MPAINPSVPFPCATTGFPPILLLTNRRHGRLHRTTARRQIRSCLTTFVQDCVKETISGRHIFVDMSEVERLALRCRLGVAPYKAGLSWLNADRSRTRVGWYEQVVVSALRSAGDPGEGWEASPVWWDLYARAKRVWERRQRQEEAREGTGEIGVDMLGHSGPNEGYEDDDLD